MIVRAQQFSWAKKGGLWAYDYGYGVANDSYGNLYVAGKYEMNANFSGVVLPCQGNHDIFLAQYSPSGNLNWIRTAGGYTGDYATCVSVDKNNFVYTAGEIEGTNALIKFQGSPIT
ncbi:MAG: SBBP repeat-containing protein, partial [Bacteroidota bacterium]